MSRPQFFVFEDRVTMEVHADYIEGGGLVAKILEWMIGQHLDYRCLYASGRMASIHVQIADLPKIREWCREHGFAEKPTK